jgi:iron complex outermembrane recepter protein
MEQGPPQFPCAVVAGRWIACAGLALLLGLVPGAQASATESVALTSNPIAPQPLAAALAEFAHQMRLQLVYESTIVRARTSKGAPAGLVPTDALTQLLDGTGLRFEFMNARTVRIFEPVAVAPTTQSSGADAPMKRDQGRAPSWTSPLDEIVVTGWMDERQGSAADYVQNVPASVSIVSGARLEEQKLEQLADYATNIPGMGTVSPGVPGAAYVIIRGIQPLTDAPPVTYYLDDTPIGVSGSWAYTSSLGLDLPTYDLERFEVLRGPQGTLYGAGSQIGVIKYVFKQPNVRDFEARVGVDGSAIDGASEMGGSIQAMLNAPLVEGLLGVRVSAYDSYTPGYIDNLYSGAKGTNVLRQYGGRIALLWQPTESASVTIRALLHRIEADSYDNVETPGATTVPDTGAAWFSQAVGSYGDLATRSAFLYPYSKSLNLYSATARWKPGSYEIVSATAWSSNRFFYSSDSSAVNGIYYPQWSDGAVPPGLALSGRDIDHEKFSEELHIVSPPGRPFEWMLGGFYTREDVTDRQYTYAFDNSYHPIAFFAPSLGFSTLPSTYKELAIFGDLTWRVSQHVDLVGGIRYSHNDQQFHQTFVSWNSPTSYDFGRSSEGAVTWMATADYRFTPGVMLYGRVATSFQPGGPNGSTPGIPLTVKGEHLTNYESGLKAEFLERKGLVDLSLFYIDWKNIQMGVSNGMAGYLANAGHAISQGLELMSSYSPLRGLTLAYNAAYTQCEFISVIPAANYVLPGYQLSNVPKWSMSSTVDYAWALKDLWRAHIGGSFRWIGQEWSGLGAVTNHSGYGYPAVVLPAYSVLDVNANIVSGPLTVRAFARNVMNKRAYLQSGTAVDYVPNPPTPVNIYHNLLQPRTVGIGFEYLL